MKRTSLHLARLTALVLGVCSWAADGRVWAGAWTQEKGRGQVIVTVTATRAADAFDEDGDLVAAPLFRKEDVDIYAEYGLRETTTILLHPRYTRLRPQGSPNTSGLAETEIGIRQRLWRQGNHVASVQASVFIPAGTVLTSGGFDSEVRALYGYAFKIRKRTGYIAADFAYRRRAHGHRDELRPDLTIGLRPSKRWLLLSQSFNVFTLGSGETNVFRGNQGKVLVSAVYALTRNVSLQLGMLSTVRGEDVPRERGALAALWFSF